METRWSALMPDARNVTPLYLQLARNLATASHCGVWSAGEALPSERTLSDAIGVSRITARKAIELLVEQGLIRRARGAGSFITPRVRQRALRGERLAGRPHAAVNGRGKVARQLQIERRHIARIGHQGRPTGFHGLGASGWTDRGMAGRACLAALQIGPVRKRAHYITTIRPVNTCWAVANTQKIPLNIKYLNESKRLNRSLIRHRDLPLETAERAQ